MNGTTQRLFTQAHDPDRLPVPTLARHTLLRVGIQNVWEYDTGTRFVARDGRLLLRGQNESGKTKAIELSLPAVVDAILRAERLDPFGERARPMRENLIGPHTGDDTTVVIGYVWAEFGRLDQLGQPRYHTAGYGVRASRNGAGFTSWCFLTELRPDVDFELFPGNQPRTQRDLESVLGSRGQVFEMPKQLGAYRSAVNRTLFGFEEIGQFDNLMRLLIELRRPQLAKHLRPNDLSEILSTSLPPLDVNLVTKVAEGVDRLQEHRDAVEGLRETLSTIARFNGTYRRYLQTVVAEQAAGVRTAASRVDDAARAARDAAAKLEQAKLDKEAAKAERAELATTRAKLQTRVDTLKNSDRFQAVEALADARRLAAEVDQTIERVNRRLEGEEHELARASENLEKQQRKLAGCKARVTDAYADATGTARLPGLETDQRQAMALVDQEDLDGASTVIAAAITQVRGRIAELSPHDTALAEARSEINSAQERLEARAEQASEARSDANQAAAAVGTVTRAFRQQVATWADSLEELVLDPDFGEQAAMVQADRIRDLVDDAARGHRGELVDELGRLGADLEQATRHHDSLTADRDALLAEEYAPPKLAPWRQPAPARPGAPLYLLGAFRETVPSDQQAAVEAALEAAQLLDAWVQPDGTIDHPEHDLGLCVDPIADRERSLLRIIEPVPAGGIDQRTAVAVLASIGLGDSDRDTWVDLDGRFRIGRLEGRHTKQTAQYLGRTLRERDRLRRLAELAEQIAAAHELLATVAEARDRLHKRLQLIDSEVRRFPSFRPVEKARVAAETLDETARSLETQVKQAEQALTTLREQATKLTYMRDQTAAKLGLTLWAGRLDDLTALVDGYERAAKSWIDAERQLKETQEQVAFAEVLFAQATDRCAGTDRELEQLADELAKAVERVATLEEIVDTTNAEQVLADLAEAEGELRHVQQRQENLDRGWEDRVSAVARSQAATEDADKALATERMNRTTIVASFRNLADLGIVQDTTNIGEWPEASPREWSETTALHVARRIAEALGNVRFDEEARNRSLTNLNRAFQELTVAMPPELQVLPRNEHEVALYTVVYDAGERSMFELANLLAADIRARERRMDEEDKRLIDEFLSGEIRDNIRRTLREARALVDQINGDLRSRATPSGQTINLQWRVHEDAPAGTAEAVELLRTTPGVNRAKDQALAQFLKERLEQARTDPGEASIRERLIDLLDYRRWHQFTVVQRHPGDRDWSPLTRRIHAKGSGGSKAATLHLPLFAAAAAFYSSARAIAPRLVVLDEAFAGIDSPTTAKLLDLAVEWDLDLVMTSWREWMCFPELPGLSIYEVSRDPESHVVDTEWFIWDGSRRREMAS